MVICSSPPSNLRHRVLTCLDMLSDRDTYSVASNELESIARNLEPRSFQTFLSCIHSSDASDKSPVRKHCVRLLVILSETHGNNLAPHISKMISNITRRLRDPDSSVRSACISSVAALASHVTKPSFSTFSKALADALFTEQDVNLQIGAALCLASAIDAAPNPEPLKLAKLLPRIDKLLKCESHKGKPALLTLLGSVIGSGGASGYGSKKTLVPCLVGFLGSKDWAARKSAAEALAKLAVAEREFLSECKSDCLKTFENHRFDKVKVVRDAMSQMMEDWARIPDIPDDFSPPSLPLSSTKGKVNDGCNPVVARNTSISDAHSSQLIMKTIPTSSSIPPGNSLATTARKRSPLGCKDGISPASVQKPDLNQPWQCKVEIAAPNAPTSRGSVEGNLKEREENSQDKKTNEKMTISRSETKRVVFSIDSDDKLHKLPLGCKDGISPASLQKPDLNQPWQCKVEIAAPNATTLRRSVEGNLKEREENVQDKKTNEKMTISRSETKRVFFSIDSDDKLHKLGGLRSGSPMAPLHDESPDTATVARNVTDDLHRNPKDMEDLFSIRSQLVQIEKQQSNLMDLLQRFIGSSQNGMQSLETRVHGLELVLDEISYGQALSSGRMTRTNSSQTTCCLLPRAKFWSSKCRKKTVGRLTESRCSTSSSAPNTAVHYRTNKSSDGEILNHPFRGSGGFIVNPLAEIPGQSRGVLDAANH